MVNSRIPNTAVMITPLFNTWVCMGSFKNFGWIPLAFGDLCSIVRENKWEEDIAWRNQLRIISNGKLRHAVFSIKGIFRGFSKKCAVITNPPTQQAPSPPPPILGEGLAVVE